MRALAAIALLAWLAACVEEEAIPLAAEDGDLLILATVDAGGEVREVRAGLAGAPAPRLQRADDQRAVAFVVRARDLVDTQGRPLSAEQLGALRVLPRARAMEAEGCGRCMAQTRAPPEVYAPGELCPVPPFAAAAGAGLGAEELERVRAALLISWPGSCACPVPSVQAQPDPLRLVLGGGQQGFDAPEAVALTSSGAVGVFAQRLAKIYPPGAAQPQELRADHLFPGPVLAAAGDGQGSFLVAALAPGEEVAASLERVELRGGALVQSQASPALGFAPAAAFGLPGLVVLTGRTARSPILPVAELWPSGGEPHRIDQPQPYAGDDVIAVSRFAEGELAVAFQHGAAVYQSDGRLVGRSQVVGPDAPMDVVVNVGVLGRSIYLCASGQDNVALHRIVAPVGMGAGAPEELWRQPGPSCGGFSPEPGRPGLRINLSDGSGLLLQEGRAPEPRGALTTTLAVQRAASLVPGWILLQGPEGQVGRLQLSDGRVELLHRPGTPDFAGRSLLVHGSAVLALDPSRPAVRFADPSQAPERFALGGLPAGATIAGLAQEPGGEALLFGAAAGGRWLGRLEAGATAVELLTLELPEEALRGGAGVGPGRYLLYTEHELWLYDGQALRAVEIDWDDPSTAQAEGPPVACEDAGGSTTIWKDARAIDGVAWAVGCDGALVRVSPFSLPPRGEALRLDRPPDQTIDVGGDDDLLSVGPVCADLLYLGAMGDGAAYRETGRVWVLGPYSYQEGEQAALGGLPLRKAPGLELGRSTNEISAGPPSSLLWSGRSLVMLYGAPSAQRGAALVLGGRERFWLGDPLIGGRMLSDGRVLAVSAAGRLYLGSP